MPFGVLPCGASSSSSSFFFINGQPGSKVGEPEDPTATALTRTSAQLWFRVHVSEETWSDLGFFVVLQGF